MTTSAETTAPHITVSGTSYEIEKLNDRSKMLVGDLIRTVQEYTELTKSYGQSVTLNAAYSSGLKDEVEKAELPVLFHPVSGDEKPQIKIDDVNYDASEIPDSVKATVQALVRANEQKTGLEYRLRQLDAARNFYIAEIQNEIEESQPQAMDPQPSQDISD